MLCGAAMVVFGILGLFSLRYRALARQAFHCVFQTVRLKPCDTGFDLKVRSKVTARLLRFPRVARGWRRHYRAVALFFVATLLGSFAYSAHAGYNLLVYGSCEPGEDCELSWVARQMFAPSEPPEPVETTEETKPVEIVFVREKGCPISRRVAKFLDERIKPNYPVKVREHYIRQSEAERRLAPLLRRYRTGLRAPLVFVGETCLKKFNRSSLFTLERRVREALRRQGDSSTDGPAGDTASSSGPGG